MNNGQDTKYLEISMGGSVTSSVALLALLWTFRDAQRCVSIPQQIKGRSGGNSDFWSHYFSNALIAYSRVGVRLRYCATRPPVVRGTHVYFNCRQVINPTVQQNNTTAPHCFHAKPTASMLKYHAFKGGHSPSRPFAVYARFLGTTEMPLYEIVLFDKQWA